MSKSLPRPSPILKKTYDYYKTIGNLWDSRYLTSKKLAKYYHIPHESYISGPNSPTSLSISHSKKSSEDYLQKAVTQAKQSKNRLNQRKTERIHVIYNQIQSLSKQIALEFADTNKIHNKPNPEPQVSKNAWENLKEIPDSKLRHVFPKDIRQKDLQGFNCILAKNQLEIREKQLFDDLRQVNKLKERLFTIQRHSYYTKLEQRAGIEKVRNEKIEQGVYGYVKAYKVTPRLLALSLPHKLRNNDIERSDFNGMIYKECPEIIKKKEKNYLENIQKKKGEKGNDREFIEETIQSISEFEKKLPGIGKFTE